MSHLSLIVAFSENRVIGRDGDLPWRIPADLKRFKRLTMGHHLLMGRKTYESIGRLLPGRTTVIITRNRDYEVPGALICHSVEEAISETKNDDEPFVVGGAEIFKMALPHVNKLYLTQVLSDVEGDCFLEDLDFENWECLSSEKVLQDENNEFAHVFEVYQRLPLMK